MKTDIQRAEEYADIILRDERHKILYENSVVYEPGYIQRVYEFPDGAVVIYEWQSTPDGRTSPDGAYNHRFTLEKAPSPNPRKFKKGVVKQIDYPKA